MSSRQGMIDAITLRHILLERFAKGEARRLSKNFKKLSAAINKEIETDFKKMKAVALSKKTSKISQIFFQSYGESLVEALGSFAAKEAEWAGQLVLATTAAVAFSPVPQKKLLQAINARPMQLLVDGKIKKVTVEQAVKKFTTFQSKQVGQIIKDGSLNGRTTQQISKEITSLIQTRTRQQALTLVKTVTNHTATLAREAAFSENSDILTGWQWVSTLDSKTSITCAGLDGKKYKDNQTQSKPPIHWGCRSDWIPVVNPEFDLGSEINGERAAENGPVSAKLTYGGWLKSQNKAVQVEVLGATRAKLFSSGKVSIGNFTDKAGSILNLKQLEARNSLSFN